MGSKRDKIYGYGWLQSSHLPLGPKDHDAFWGTGKCRKGSLPFGVPRLGLSILGNEARSWSGKALEGLVPGPPAFGVARLWC